MKELRGKVVAVTGAGSGIGRALAGELSAKGAHLALSDIDEVGLAETARRVEGRGVTVTTAPLDVADRDAVQAWADQVVADHGKVNVIINNAGVALGAPVEDMAITDMEWLMGINFWGVVSGTQAFLPHLQAAGEGHIVNISSVFGLVGIPSQSAYNAAKFGVRGFTEALRMELDLADGGVSCSCVHPGGIKTNIAKNARMMDVPGKDMEKGRRNLEKAFITSPEKAAKVIVRGIERDQRRILIGPDAYLFHLLGHLPVGVTQRLIVAGAKRQLQ